MELASELISEFVKVTNDTNSEVKETTVYATVKKQGENTYVQIDGSDILTPVETTADANDGERVTVTIKNHIAMITGNLSSPSARSGTVNDINEDLQNTKDYIEAKLVVTEKLEAEFAKIENLDATYAQIDFANITKANFAEFFANSGIIKDVVVDNQSITGELVGVTIKGDLIEGNTIVADKLVIKGNDGLYYKLNTDGMKVEAEQTDYNSLNGSIITAKSITATKINVEDLVAFDATIGGFKIGSSAIYSGVKSSIDSTLSGLYLSSDGQMCIDSGNGEYLKLYKDSEGNLKLAISVNDLMISSSGTGYEGSTLSETIQRVIERTSTLEGDSEKYSFNFEEVDETINNLGELAGEFNKKLKYVKVTNEPAIIIGSDDSAFSVKINQSRLSFMDGINEVAYVSNDKLEINNAKINKDLWFGNFRLFERSNGNLSLKWG